MKKIVLSFLVAAFLAACNNQADTTHNTRSDTSTVEQDNTINRDTGYLNPDTMNRRDTARP